MPDLDPKLKRVTDVGGTTAYRTRDGHFDIENGLASPDGGAVTNWTIVPRSADADGWLQAAGLDRQFRRKGDAYEMLLGSVYAEPHGWAHVPPKEIQATVNEANRERVSDDV